MADTGYEQNGTINELTYNAGTDIDGDAMRSQTRLLSRLATTRTSLTTFTLEFDVNL